MLRRWLVPAVLLVAAVGCHWNTEFERVLEARRLSADLLVQFLKSVDAANSAVMADTDEASLTFAREARHAADLAQTDADMLGGLLNDLGFSPEVSILEEFRNKFAESRTLDREILDLAVANTNLKAQRLSFGAAQQAADALRDSLDAIVRSAPAKNDWQLKALAETALANAREIQVLEAPHIAEANDAEMTRLEERMATAEAAGREALRALDPMVSAQSRPHFSAATAALERLIGANAQIIRLSRRNTNVRSLALSLNQKRTVSAACEASLRALQEALGHRGFSATR